MSLQELQISVLFITHDIGVVVHRRPHRRDVPRPARRARDHRLISRPRHPTPRRCWPPSRRPCQIARRREYPRSRRRAGAADPPAGCRFRALCLRRRTLCCRDARPTVVDGVLVACHRAGQLTLTGRRSSWRILLLGRRCCRADLVEHRCLLLIHLVPGDRRMHRRRERHGRAAGPHVTSRLDRPLFSQYRIGGNALRPRLCATGEAVTSAIGRTLPITLHRGRRHDRRVLSGSPLG